MTDIETKIMDAGLGIRDIQPLVELLQGFLMQYPNMTIDNVHITSSSGASAVFIIQGLDYVVQYYVAPQIVYDIMNMYLALDLSNPIMENLNISKYVPPHLRKSGNAPPSFNVNLSYMLQDYMVPLIQVASNVCKWSRIQTLNKVPNRVEFITANLPKLLWDIGKALSGMHKKGYIHGDCTLDNIGYYNGNFCLFDFDMSKPIDENHTPHDDFRTFQNSIQFAIRNDFQPIHSTPFLRNVIKHYTQDDSYMDTLNQFEHSQIIL